MKNAVATGLHRCGAYCLERVVRGSFFTEPCDQIDGVVPLLLIREDGEGMPVIQDMADAYIEHSMVINNFVTSVRKQLKNSTCRVFGDGVKYKWAEKDKRDLRCK